MGAMETVRRAACMLAVLAAGCATQRPATPEEPVTAREPSAAATAAGALAGGAVGALYTIGIGCMGGPLGCAAGLYLSPVGFVVGAVGGAVAADSKRPSPSAPRPPELKREYAQRAPFPQAASAERGRDSGGNIVFESQGLDGRCSSYVACGNRDPRDAPMNR